ncbi:midasin-like protein [Aureococcus anophagefferens]|uniref:Midasin-like protein n=1 Tax=Aureococcus anophagefferens TaxID=44056 RepID=A0ABR1FPZ8_AURAN
MFRVAAKNGAVVRATAELDSAKQGEIPRHTILRSLERTVLSDGRERVRVAGPPAGWVSRKVLEAVEASDAAPASDAQPVAKKPKAKAKPPRPPPRVDVMRRLTAARTDATRVPWPARIRGADVVAPPRAMRWLHQKLALKQDAFLLGDPGPHARQCVLQFCAALGLEVSYVGVTRDTTEADLKQRREIRDGGVFFADQAPVEAAVHGRVLVLEGVEKAERNVLPLLNNLLENREMALEDGTFLSPRAAEGGGRLRRVDPGFFVVALGLPAPRYAGNPLDPPLRSRFAALKLEPTPPDDEYRLLAAAAPGADPTTLRALVEVVTALRGDASLPRFPELGLLSVARLLGAFPGLAPLDALHRAWPWRRLGLSGGGLDVLATAEPGGDWLDDEVLTVFHFHGVDPLDRREHAALLRGRSRRAAARDARAPLLEAARSTSATPSAGRSTRTRRWRPCSCRRGGSGRWRRTPRRRGDAAAVLHRALSPGFALLPPLGQETASRLLGAALRARGFTAFDDAAVLHLLRGDDDARRRRGRGARRRRAARFRDLEGDAIALRMGGGWMGGDARALERSIEGEKAALAREARDVEAGRDAGARARGRDARARRGARARRRRRRRTRAPRSGSSLFFSSGGAIAPEAAADAPGDVRPPPAPAGVLEATVRRGTLRIGDVEVPTRRAEDRRLVPSVHFVSIPRHVLALRDLLLEWSLDHHLLLIGNQGVGKNKLADRLLELLDAEREYVQLHRDTTALTLAPTLRDGVVVWADSPLVAAARSGRVLVVDEADKAPLEVVCVLKALAEDGELALADGRTLLRAGDAADRGDDVVPIHADFRMVVLANRPGFPFLGNDFYRECGDVFATLVVATPDLESELELLRNYGPNVPPEALKSLLLLFTKLRDLNDEGSIAYPYSTRELVKLVAHLEAFPDDDVESVVSNVFAFDAFDPRLAETLSGAVRGRGLAWRPSNGPTPFAHGNPHRAKLENTQFKAEHLNSGAFAPGRAAMGDVGTKNYSDATDRSGKINRPTSGNWDGRQHIGEGPWDGGTGGSGTAGIGGRAGPYRLDVGQELRMLSEEEKGALPGDFYDEAKKMADEAYAHRLAELELGGHDAGEYASLKAAVASQVSQLRTVLESHEAREQERSWLRHQTQGELDEARLVDGVAGAPDVYRRRGFEADAGALFRPKTPKRIKFVLDISGSMYTFNRIDDRLRRLQEAAVFILEAFARAAQESDMPNFKGSYLGRFPLAFAGFEAKYDLAVVGHSGTGPEAERLVEFGRPVATDAERLAIARRLAAHAQFAHSGDSTLEATRLAVDDAAAGDADERFVFVVSDADLKRYGITPEAWNAILMARHPEVQAYVVLISSNEDEAAAIVRGLAPGHAFIADQTERLAVTFKQIFLGSMLKNR